MLEVEKSLCKGENLAEVVPEENYVRFIMQIFKQVVILLYIPKICIFNEVICIFDEITRKLITSHANTNKYHLGEAFMMTYKFPPDKNIMAGK